MSLAQGETKQCLCKQWFPNYANRELCPLHSSTVRPEGFNYWNSSEHRWQKEPVRWNQAIDPYAAGQTGERQRMSAKTESPNP